MTPYTYAAVASINARKKETLAYLNFEVGCDVGLGDESTSMTVITGLRFTSFRSKENLNGSVAYYVLPSTVPYAIIARRGKVRRKFMGIGPRLGLQAQVPMNEVLSLQLNAAGAFLIGKRKVRAIDGTGLVYSRSKSAVIPNLEASVGLAFRPEGSNL